MPRKETRPVAMQTCMHRFSISSNYEYQYQIRKVQQTSRKGMQPLVSNSMVKLNIIIHSVYWGKNSLVSGWTCSKCELW